MTLGRVYSTSAGGLRTRKAAIIFIALGAVFLALAVLDFGLDALPGDLAGPFFALAILTLGAGGIVLFFAMLFSRLADIASDIEADESLRDDSPEEPPQC